MILFRYILITYQQIGINMGLLHWVRLVISTEPEKPIHGKFLQIGPTELGNCTRLNKLSWLKK